MTVPPDDDERPAGEDPPDAPQADDETPEWARSENLGPGAEDVVDEPEVEGDEPEAGDDEPEARGLVVVGEDIPAAPLPPDPELPEPVEAVYVEPYAEPEGDPSRTWKFIAAGLAVLVLILGVVAFTRGGDEAQAGPPVSDNQEAEIEDIPTGPDPAVLEAKRKQLEQLEQDSAAHAAEADRLATENDTLQTDLDQAQSRAQDAEAEAAAAVADAQQSANTAEEAQRQVDALTDQVESLNREIGALSSDIDKLQTQNGQLETANQDLVQANDALTEQLAALSSVQDKTYACATGLVEALRQHEDPSWWEANGDATVQTCTEAQDAINAYDARFGS